MPNPCGNVHMPNMACRECDRIRAKSNRIDVIKAGKAPSLVAHISTHNDPEKFGEVLEAPVHPKAGGPDEVSDPDESREGLDRRSADRLEVAKRALTRAQIQKSYRERKKGEDPDYLRREAARMRARRKNAQKT